MSLYVSSRDWHFTAEPSVESVRKALYDYKIKNIKDFYQTMINAAAVISLIKKNRITDGPGCYRVKTRKKSFRIVGITATRLDQ